MNSNSVAFSPEDVTEITRLWRKVWSERSRSDLVTKHGPGFFLWRAMGDGKRSSGMFYSREKIDQVLAGSGMESALRRLIDETDHERAVVVVLGFEEQERAMAITVEKLHPPKEQDWFEMPDIRRRSVVQAVWIPLRSSQKLVAEGTYGYEGYREEYYGLGSVMFDIALRDEAAQLAWSDIGISNSYAGGVVTTYIQPGEHASVKELINVRIPFRKSRIRAQLESPSSERKENTVFLWAGDYQSHRGESTGTGLVIEQRFNSEENTVWNLHQDFSTALGLLREGDAWVRPEEGYVEVARLTRDKGGDPVLLEVRSEHLRDYLKARNMNLHISSYRSRREVCASADHIVWESEARDESQEGQRWEGRKYAIHEGGSPYGAKTAVFHVSRTDVDPEEDVPHFDVSNGENVASRSWTAESSGRKLYSISGELWRSETIGPASTSERVLGDRTPSTIEFFVDASGAREVGDKLADGSRWLWFKPDIVSTVLRRRGSFLGWYTRDTGQIGLTPGSGVHFGINSLGLVNVYAKDIGLLPVWQQRIWAGSNMTPDGKVSPELLDSQMRAEPASTEAPEAQVRGAVEAVNSAFEMRAGKPLFRSHQATEELFAKVHRFRALDRGGLLELAKDLARLTVESIDGKALSTITAPPEKMKAGSIKHLEKILAATVPQADAEQMTAVFVGINELRQADAHMPSADLDDSIKLAGIEDLTIPLNGARQMLDLLVASLFRIAGTLANA